MKEKSEKEALLKERSEAQNKLAEMERLIRHYESEKAALLKTLDDKDKEIREKQAAIDAATPEKIEVLVDQPEGEPTFDLLAQVLAEADIPDLSEFDLEFEFDESLFS